MSAIDVQVGTRSRTAPRVLPPLVRPVWVIAAVVVLVLVAAAAGYGYHRDELYFLQAARHLAWGYADQPPLTPLLARLMTAIAADSLVVLRLPAALAGGAVVLVTGLLARELGAERRGQILAAACMAVSALLPAVSHLLSTSAFDLLAWTVLSWLIVRVLRGADPRVWLLVGVVAGVGLMNKALVAFYLAGVGAGVLLAGPRHVLRERWLWLGALIALVMSSPYLVWQAANGWPQLGLSAAIASGSSGTSEPVALFLPFQLVLVSPLLVPVWGAGLVRLFRDPDVRDARAFAWAYGVLAVVFMATGGKPYYLGGLYPVLLAAGAVPLVSWLTRGRRTLRRAALGSALGLSAVVAAVLMLPVVPASALPDTPIVDINYDAGETIGWPRFVDTVAAVYHDLPDDQRADAVLVTGNYGEAGALDHYGPAHGLPRAYSGHNAYGFWGAPPDSADTAVVVGLGEAFLQRHFATCVEAARIDNGLDLDNDEQGAIVWVCRDPVQPWSALWPAFRRLG